MTAILAAEVRKLTTVWTTAVVALVGLVLVTVAAAFLVFETELSGPFDGQDAQVAAAIGQIGGMNVVVLVIGLLSVTTEFRHGTIGRTLQVTPSRTRVLLAKSVVAGGAGIAFFAAALVVVAAILLLAGPALSIGSATTAALWQGPVGLALTAMFGVALGALLRSQVLAVALALIHVMLVESLVMQFLPTVGRWLPFQALGALYRSEEVTAMSPQATVAPLDPLLGLAVFVVYGVALAGAAGVLMRVRDV